ncbi:chaplin [Streptomyces pathocidini]|uniref:chaplin n=1 Tax=Streptomyces pathocidini TaxID=1650571 RepID=UPI0033FD8699
MRRIARKGLVTAMATGGVLAAAAGYAHADSGAQGAAVGSPGLLSGNAVQALVHVPVNVCGNAVSVAGLLNPVAGNDCTNSGGSGPGTPGGSSARGEAEGSPGVASGNSVQLPVDVPVNVTGNTVNVVGVGNEAAGNSSSNGSPEQPESRMPEPPKTAPKPPKVTPEPAGRAPRAVRPQTVESLARTGSDGDMLGFFVPASAGLLLGGGLLYRRFRPGRLS